jgi:hypothetical protein
MALPRLSSDGELPPGVHAASLREVVERFSIGSAQRRSVALRLERIYRVARATNRLERFVVFGSFVTTKADPQDVDVFLIMADTFDASRLTEDARLLFDHGAAQAHFGASVFWVRQGSAWPDEEAAIEFWQVKRADGRRGIVEIVAETS